MGNRIEIEVNVDIMILSFTIASFLKLTHSEIEERIEEFEIFKNDQLDYIRLNNLFDFCNVDFNQDLFVIRYSDAKNTFDLMLAQNKEQELKKLIKKENVKI